MDGDSQYPNPFPLSPPLSPPPIPFGSPASSGRSSFVPQLKSRSRRPLSPSFQRLSPEIYERILSRLKSIHDQSTSSSCQTCYYRDLYALSLVSRAWDRAVRPQLYERIHLVGNDSSAHVKKYKMKFGARLKLLRRTLRDRRVLANYVRDLKLPNMDLDRNKTHVFNDLVASIVMACPNLERLVGYYQTYGHEFDRLTHALSTRRQLKEHVWIIGENTAITQRSHHQLPPGLMDAEQVRAFLHYHTSWSGLQILFLHSHSHGILERHVFEKIFPHLPSLQHLCISSFDQDDFDDHILQALPPLTSLRLQDLLGVSSRGLLDYARSNNARNLRNLSLIHLDLAYMSTISSLLLYLHDLKRFTIVQEHSPEIQIGELVFQPVIASSSLNYLHWDIFESGSANANMAASIRARGFPELRVIRAPSDHDGVLQSLCKPRMQIVLASDKYSKAYKHREVDSERSRRTLFECRKAAQERLEAAQQHLNFQVVVEEEGVIGEVYEFNGFMGTIGSRVTYSLEPDVPQSDDPLIDFPDILSNDRETNPKDGCVGMWNASHHTGKKWWNHTERARYQAVDLLRFF